MNGMVDAKNNGASPDQTDDTPSAEILALMKQQQKVALRSEITDSTQQWASHWSEQDIDAYLSHYSDKFVSDTGMNIDEWSAHRAEPLAKPTWVQVMLLDIQLDIVSDSLVRAEFTQNYSASNYQDVSSKTLS